MGRAGGGSRGGGGRSGGFRSGGGGRSGGFSGGGRSGGFGGVGHGGFGGPHHGHHHHHHHHHGPLFHGPWFRRPVVHTVYVNNGNGGNGGNSGGGSNPFLSIFIIFMTFVVICSVISAMNGISHGYGSITTSTIEREKIEDNSWKDNKYYTDEIGDWIQNTTVLKRGLNKFYDLTGVIPYVYITDDIFGDDDPSQSDMEEFASQKYEELFGGDEGRAMLLFWELDGEYKMLLWIGSATYTVMDEEACNILLDYVDSYYYSDRTEDEMFADAFADAGKRIMNKEKSFIEKAAPIIVVVVLLAIVVVIAKAREKKKEQEIKEKEANAAILNADIETMQDQELQDLAKKYEEKEN